MSTPGFHATTALAASAGRYRAAAGGASPRTRLVPQQFDEEVLSPFEDQELSYACDSATNKCKCKGVLDCDNMRGSGDCQGGVEVCTASGCWCQWH
ncbi:MAG: hypothetical protein KIS91_05860 [Anaerolineae bacterium]|nr:hypothetical protein [Anaerolineae bacterium]